MVPCAVVLASVLSILSMLCRVPCAVVLASVLSMLSMLCRVPCAVVLASVLSPLVYDYDAPEEPRRWLPYPRAVVWHLILGGVVQPLLLAAVLLLLCPLLATLVMACKALRPPSLPPLSYEALLTPYCLMGLERCHL